MKKCVKPNRPRWHTKRERYYGRCFNDRESLVKMIEQYIEYYNNKRLQRRLGILTPMEKNLQYYLSA